MALPLAKPIDAPATDIVPVFAEASDRAGPYTMQQLEVLLQPLLAVEEDDGAVAWPAAASWAFVLGSSLALWSAIIFVITRLI